MARRKDTIVQTDFSFGATRPESVEREDTPLVAEAVKEALNTIVLTTGSIEGRPGLRHIGSTAANTGHEVDLGAGRVFEVHVVEDGVVVYDADGAEVASFLASAWDSNPAKYGTMSFSDVQFWVSPDPETSSIVIGASSYPQQALVLADDGTWSFGEFQYSTATNGAISQPYWPYYPDVSLTPSARTGAITVTASSGIFTAGFEGVRILLDEREVLLTGLVSPTVMNATVTEELPPTFNFTVASVSGYTVGDAVDHETLGGQGVITGISGSVLTVRATNLWDGFSSSGKLIGPNAAQAISVKADAPLAPTLLWTMQMGNPLHGYPGWGVKHKGHAYYCEFPNAPNAYAGSRAGRIDDFKAGPNDGDAFVEKIGANNGGDLLFIISAEDLLFFTTRGLYYQPTRGGQDITPGNIAPVQFSQIGCNSVVPVSLDDGAVFVDSVGSQIHAAILVGDQYKSWSTENISKYHSHLISGPSQLGATKYGSERPENFIFSVSSDGSVAVCQWDRTQNKIGWRPWNTDGKIISVYQSHGRNHAIVDRVQGNAVVRFREVFDDSLYLDCVGEVEIDGATGAIVPPGGGLPDLRAQHLNGVTAAMYMGLPGVNGWDLGDGLVVNGVCTDENGVQYQFPSYAAKAQIGLPFTIDVTPWPRRSVYSQRGTREVKRLIKMFLTVQDTLAFKYQGVSFGGYRVGDDMSVPPKVRSEEIGIIVGGRGAFIDRPIIVDRPGPFRLLKIRQRVSV